MNKILSIRTLRIISDNLKSKMIGIPFLGLAAGNSKLPSVTPRQLPFRSLKPSRGNSLTRHRAFWGGQYQIR